MAKLRITMVNGDVGDYPITPSIEYAFEAHAKKGFSKAFREDEKQGDVFFVAYECLKRSGTLHRIPLFGASFIEMLAKVEVLDDDAPNASSATALPI